MTGRSLVPEPVARRQCEIDVPRAILTTLTARTPEVRLADCSLWATGGACDRNCLREALELESTVQSIAARWYAKKKCVYCLNEEIDDLVGYMLFVDEAPLLEPVKGVSSFTLTFPRRGPRDKQGRSLRDFDLQKRIFRYPLSYMIYSDLFEGLPAPIRERVYRRLYDVLTGRETSRKYATLSAADRHAVFEILLDTKPSLPAYWTLNLQSEVRNCYSFPRGDDRPGARILGTTHPRPGDHEPPGRVARLF